MVVILGVSVYVTPVAVRYAMFQPVNIAFLLFDGISVGYGLFCLAIGMILGGLFPVPFFKARNRKLRHVGSRENAESKDSELVELRRLAHEAALEEFPELVRR